MPTAQHDQNGEGRPPQMSGGRSAGPRGSGPRAESTVLFLVGRALDLHIMRIQGGRGERKGPEWGTV